MLGFAGEAIVQCIDVSFCILSAQLAEGEGSKMFPSPILKTNIVVGKKRLGSSVQGSRRSVQDGWGIWG